VSVYYSYNQRNEYLKLRAVEADIEQRMEEEKKAQEKLELELEYNMTDAYVEQMAREKLGLVKSTDIKFEDQ
jgi:cell division protein DivIC